MRDLISEIAQTMRSNKVRTILTGIAVTWGVFMLIVLLSMARGVTNAFDHDTMSRNSAMLRVYGGRTSVPYQGYREGRYIRMSDDDLEIIPAEHGKHVEKATSTIYGRSSISSTKATVSSSYDGVFPSKNDEYNIGDMSEGRFINDRDIKEKAKVMVIPRYYARELFPPEGKDALGQRVTCSGLSFKVVGIYDSDWNRSFYIPFTTARMMTADRKDIGNITVSLKNVHSEEDGKEIEDAVRKTLSTVHHFNPDDENAVYISNRFTNFLQARSAMGILDTSVWVLGILTLLTGIVGISNIMFVTVKERTHEIGIRRAIGAKPRKILTQVIAESVAITLLFGYIGIVLGMAVTQVISMMVGSGDNMPLRNPTVSLAIAVEVTVVLVLAGALAGLFPALKALKVKPVEALRDE